MKGSHKVLPTQYGLTTLSLAQVAYYSSQNSSPFLVSLLLLYEVGNVTVLVDFDSDTCPVLLCQANQAVAGH